nr:hypothetical protein [uncultured Psychroserpens sp.]
MKTIQKFTMFTALAVFTVFSCNENNKKDTVIEESDMNKEMKTDTMNSDDESMTDSKKVRAKNYTMKDGNRFSYNTDDRGVLSVTDWNDYNSVSYNMYDLETNDYNMVSFNKANLDSSIANLGNTIPSWLKTEEVMEDVADVQKEYKELMAEKNASEKEQKENLEELREKFDDLREELNETIDEYVKINEEAIEEFNEEIKDGDWEDAWEEYNEEIKKLDKIVEDKS